MVQPPFDHFHERAGQHASDQRCRHRRARTGRRNDALLNYPRQEIDAKVQHVVELSSSAQRLDECTRLSNVSEKLFDRCQTLGARCRPIERLRQIREQFLITGIEDVILVAVVRVEGCPPDASAIEDVLDGDRVEVAESVHDESACVHGQTEQHASAQHDPVNAKSVGLVHRRGRMARANGWIGHEAEPIELTPTVANQDWECAPPTCYGQWVTRG